MTQLTPFYEDVQHHYDLSNDFFALFLDPTMTYSCAYFERDDYTLEQAQIAKIDLSLDKIDVQPGMTMLEIGCGWGSTAMRALERFDVRYVGLTLSKNQHYHVNKLIEKSGYDDRAEVRLQGWEEFDGRADRIVSIAAFEAFRRERYDDFFAMTYDAMPADGRMLLHTIVCQTPGYLSDNKIRFDRDDVAFMRFMTKEIFPGGHLPFASSTAFKGVKEFAEAGGYTVERMQPLRMHYAKTLDMWTAALASNRERAVELKGQENYDRYMRYLPGCADWFRRDVLDVVQFTLTK
ncbi:cyclopropane mycolic acid synthase family methyltransferase [Nocardia stercoris]|uniref:Methyltransferase domain-containing protein n=1 Tax=Nocardia stercoris TaxID=2483361 RepID=A0A3M2LCT8_9NOCA|nr:cyclopropane mycolic acid synthase family methyltransferase [Nocardia stercoris]RMI35359.1 methyltransferase domain-containing protein [Nocardia stercoris]